MELPIGERIRKLRTSRNLTQEEMAGHLGISFQAISKWERGDGYPDITLLPSIAAYFGVTVDELIGMDEITSVRRFDEINQLWKANREKGLHQDNVNLMKDALKSYPNNAVLLVQLAASLARLGETDQQKREYLWEAIQVQERIIQYCKDSEVRSATLFNLANDYFRYGDTDKALEYAYKLPNLYKARENALARILTDDTERHDVSKGALEPLLWALELHLKVLSETEHNPDYLKKAELLKDILK